MLRALGKSSLLLLCTAVGLAAGSASYLLAGLVLLMIYGDDGQSGHPGKSLMYILMIGSFGIFGFGGVFVGLKLSSRMFKSNE
ncbi:MAG: hypothetical protein JWO71_536 [Candidatus Acidoferrum typicum]|nr:hypothetical protein [Candidatus Acidoferrum typicum]